jgi:hypothetical protein
MALVASDTVICFDFIVNETDTGILFPGMGGLFPGMEGLFPGMEDLFPGINASFRLVFLLHPLFYGLIHSLFYSQARGIGTGGALPAGRPARSSCTEWN